MSQSKVIVITGVTKGLGKAMTLFYLSQGHTVIGCARSEDLLKSLREEIDVYADRCYLSIVDVSDDEQVKSWSTETLKYGSPDIVINNAAVAHPSTPLWEVSPKDFNLVIDVGVKSYASVMRYFIPQMLKSGRGVVVNVSSVMGRQPCPQRAAYTASKHAVEGMSKAVSMELPEPLTCVILDPGIVRTNMSDSALPAEITTRLTPATEWAEKVCPFILSVDRSMNGQILEVYEILDIKCGCYFKDGVGYIQGIDY